MSIEAMKQALEALRNAEVVYMEQLNAMYALQQAIEQAEKQEPVAFRNINKGEFCTGGFLRKDWAKWQPLYAAPVHAVDMSQERVDETDKDRHDFEAMVKKGTKAWADTPDGWVDDLRGGAEAVAWMWKDGTLTSDPDFADGTWTPLFTAPPKREWIGLTAKDLAEIPSSCYEGAIWADAKLKEKNHG